MYRYFFKPVIDIVSASLILLISMPVMIVVCLIIFISIKGNPFFYQKRPGYKGKVFTIIKLKTMTDERDTDGKLLPDDQRITTIGKIVRKTSLDEIPQLLNILKGDMSLIGPRPLLVSYLPLYNEEQARRHDVKPGITGWAQVNGRDAISYESKFEMDVYYVDNQSFKLDCNIFYRSIINVLIAKDESPEAAVTNQAWQGNGK
ncbi:MAG: sugar transferase [Carboxylicivirga sp.]|jgi:lipopolysaccharide/colanic/teichoic acid biosynthesis glycosyltransferase|nr:sugar transferase [Carboxylicivirga sp.]MCT4646370.1 sugar transferase [Carboxylicivirga sp.]